MKRLVLLSALTLSALVMGCASTQTRESTAVCAGDCKDACPMKACDHANAALPCPNCQPGKPCCAKCAAKMAETCPDCIAKKTSGESAHACPDCKDGKMCAQCEAAAKN